MRVGHSDPLGAPRYAGLRQRKNRYPLLTSPTFAVAATEELWMNDARRPVLAATVHDPDGTFVAVLKRIAPALREIFGGFGILATESTSDDVVALLERDLAAEVGRAPADGNIGRHRRESVRLASGESAVLYSDLDNVLRWIEADSQEVAKVLTSPDADLIAVGRTERAMAACPRRLRDTEAIVNHIYALATGRRWDLMFAVRLLSPVAARLIVEQGAEDSLANDVEWPLLIERAGLEVGYREADGLSYRIRRDFDADSDQHDEDPLLWIERIEIANLHGRVLKEFLESTGPTPVGGGSSR